MPPVGRQWRSLELLADDPSFVARATQEFPDLAEALAGHANVEDALQTWSAQQTQIGNRMLLLGRQMEQALIWSIPDFARMDEAAMRT